ncbi:hypothetical protein [Curvibacter fontanus]
MIETLKFAQHAQRVTFEFEKIYVEAKRVSLDTPSAENLARYSNVLSNAVSLYRQFQEEQLAMLRTLYPRAQQQRLSITNHLRSLAKGHSD